MGQKSVEERLSILEKKIEELICENEKLKAINEIQNLMGRYEAIHNVSDMHRSWEFFARDTPDTWIEISNWGLVEGFDEIKKMWSNLVMESEEAKGLLFEHPLATPIIVVADDGKTAKATWHSPGHETKPREGKLIAHWCWGKYAIDFVKEEGEWRIWHFKWFRVFITPFDLNWIDRPRDLEIARQVDVECQKKPSMYHKPYFPDTIAISVPPAPRPYKTWTNEEKNWHLKPNENI